MSKNSKLILLISLLVLLIVAAAVLFLLPGKESAPAPTEAPTAAPTAAPTEAPTAAPTEAPTEVPTEAPTEAPAEALVFHQNPLTGEPLDAPATSRIFAFAVNNQSDALPHVGTQEADILFEMYVNGYMTRCLALYSDLSKVDTIGSIRSMRYNFTDICQAYDAIMYHCSGSDQVLADMKAAKIDNIWAEANSDISFRDQGRRSKGYKYEHTLMADVPGLYQYAVDKGIRVTAEENKSYSLNFAEDGTPVNGETANVIDIMFKIKHITSKQSTMTYSEELGRYVYTQYGRDGSKDDPENFENVFVMFAKVTHSDGYHTAELIGDGEGYYACNGKIIPIQWHRAADNEPFTYTLTDGTPLVQGIGNSYIAIVPLESSVEWE